MPDYKITLTDAQEDILKHIACAAGKPVQQILDEQAFFRIKEQLDQWIEEYLKDVSNLTAIQQSELDAHLVACKQAFVKHAKERKEKKSVVL